MDAPTEEQKAIIDSANKNNIIVDAVAGSGKTTTVLWIAKTCPEKKILLLTFNKWLKRESCSRRNRYELFNLEIQTYHGIASKVYRTTIHNDVLLQNNLKNTESKYNAETDLLILDEVQDMNDIYFELVSGCIKYKTLILLGDPSQKIYGYMGANLDYLCNYNNIWGKEFKKLALSTSFRLTNQMGAFMNNIVLGKQRFQTIKDGPPVYYLHVNPWHKAAKIIYNTLIDFINTGTYKPDDIFILCHSVKSNTAPYTDILNLLSKKQIPIYKPTNDEEELRDDVIKNKIVVTTYHQSKGRERKLVVLYGFDSFLLNTCPDTNFDVCPEMLYVALTRAHERLYIVQSESMPKLPFIKHTLKDIKDLNYVEYIGSTDECVKAPRVKPTRDFSVSGLTQHLNSRIELELDKYVSKLKKKLPTHGIEFQAVNFIENTELNTIEPVSHLNGLALAALYELKISGETTIEKIVKNHPKYREIFIELDNVVENLLKASNYCISIIEGGLDHYINQISTYDWLTEDVVELSTSNLERVLNGENLEFETKVHYIDDRVEIIGLIDVIQDDSIFEIKCVSELKLAHFLQVIIYAWLATKNDVSFNHIYLYNISSDELYEIRNDPATIDTIVRKIINYKINKKPSLLMRRGVNNG